MFKFILNLLFPPRCVSCKKEGDFLCNDCVQKLKIRKIKNYPSEKEEFNYLDGVIYGMSYADNPAIQAAIQQFKYKFTQDLSDYFGILLSKKLNELSMTQGKRIILIPVPLHKKRLNYRGFNQAEVLAKAVQKHDEKIEIQNILFRTRHTSQQAKLNKKERQKNLEDAFELQENAKYNPQNIYFIVDDVFTTGSTLEAAAKALKEEGWGNIYGLVIARAFK